MALKKSTNNMGFRRSDEVFIQCNGGQVTICKIIEEMRNEAANAAAMFAAERTTIEHIKNVADVIDDNVEKAMKILMVPQ